MKKVLYFIGAGMNFTNDEVKGSDIGNYRIRTTFKDLDSNIIFVEFSRGYKHERINNKSVITSDSALYVNHLFNLSVSENENESAIKYDYEGYSYTKADIIRFIKDHFNIQYDEIIITTGDKFMNKRIEDKVNEITLFCQVDDYNIYQEDGRIYISFSIYDSDCEHYFEEYNILQTDDKNIICITDLI